VTTGRRRHATARPRLALWDAGSSRYESLKIGSTDEGENQKTGWLLVNAIRFLISLRGELHIDPTIASAGPQVYWLTIVRRGETGGESPREMRVLTLPF
jgi:hypothetical protein